MLTALAAAVEWLPLAGAGTELWVEAVGAESAGTHLRHFREAELHPLGSSAVEGWWWEMGEGGEVGGDWGQGSSIGRRHRYGCQGAEPELSRGTPFEEVAGWWALFGMQGQQLVAGRGPGKEVGKVGGGRQGQGLRQCCGPV